MESWGSLEASPLSVDQSLSSGLEVEMEKMGARSPQPWLHLIVTKEAFKKYILLPLG